MKKVTLVLLALILSACSFGTQTELSRNKSKWQNANIDHYRFELNVGCFCAFREQMPVTVEVKDGEVISLIGSNGNPISATAPSNEFIMQYATIERLFSELESDAVKGADKVTVTYDPTYGYPSDISIDFIELAMDDELAVTVSGFEPLS